MSVTDRQNCLQPASKEKLLPALLPKTAFLLGATAHYSCKISIPPKRYRSLILQDQHSPKRYSSFLLQDQHYPKRYGAHSPSQNRTTPSATAHFLPPKTALPQALRHTFSHEKQRAPELQLLAFTTALMLCVTLPIRQFWNLFKEE